jgi:hypothetical protein
MLSEMGVAIEAAAPGSALRGTASCPGDPGLSSPTNG